MTCTVVVDEQNEGQRLDVFLADFLHAEYSRSQIKKMIEEELIRVGHQVVSPHYKINCGDSIEIVGKRDNGTHLQPEEIKLDIIYEDDDLVIVNKPAGMVVHPANGNQEHTLVHALLYHIKSLKASYGETERPGIVHRLDKDTTGILVVAKHEKAHRFLAEQFKDHSIDRVYYALVKGVVQHDEGICEEPVGRAFVNKKKVVVKPSGGKDASTSFKVIKRYDQATLLEVRLKTGRTHQIRVHMSHLGHPVMGDSLYGVKSPWIDRQALHAKVLGFRHPLTGEKMYFESDLPADFEYVMKKLAEEV